MLYPTQCLVIVCFHGCEFIKVVLSNFDVFLMDLLQSQDLCFVSHLFTNTPPTTHKSHGWMRGPEGNTANFQNRVLGLARRVGIKYFGSSSLYIYIYIYMYVCMYMYIQFCYFCCSYVHVMLLTFLSEVTCPQQSENEKFCFFKSVWAQEYKITVFFRNGNKICNVCSIEKTTTTNIEVF